MLLPRRYTRNLFLRAFCFVYLAAFLSFYIQIPGLYGDNGILPASAVLETSEDWTIQDKWQSHRTLLWLAPWLSLDTHYAMDFMALLGIILAFTGFVSQKFCTMPLFIAMWTLYLSLYEIGQIFVNDYDKLLLEAGVLVIFLAPFTLWNKRHSSKDNTVDAIIFWCIRWLLLRYLFTCGIVKLLSGCPKWWSLTAFEHHFETMPLPSPLSYYAHYLAPWILKLVNVYANMCELILPLLFLLPSRNIHIIGFVFQIFLQICIVLTGNFSFVNLLLVTLMLSLLDDGFFYAKKWRTPRMEGWVHKALCIFVYAFCFFAMTYLYRFKLNGWTVDVTLEYTKTQFDAVFSKILAWSLTFPIFLSFFLTVLCSFVDFRRLDSAKKTIWSFILMIFYTVLCGAYIYISMVPLHKLTPATNSTIQPWQQTISKVLQPYRVVNDYGMFKRMQGVNGRLEIVLEGADNIDGPWAEYNFLYKPSNVNHTLPFVAPYSPRLDWQLHWAAYSSIEHEPWMLSLASRLLWGLKDVVNLIDKSHSLFAKEPPKYIRGVLYKYKYSKWDKSSQNAWWTRESVGLYFPVYSHNSDELHAYLRARNLWPKKEKVLEREKEGLVIYAFWKKVFDGVRFVTSQFEATLLLWSVFTAGCAIITTSSGNRK